MGKNPRPQFQLFSPTSGYRYWTTSNVSPISDISSNHFSNIKLWLFPAVSNISQLIKEKEACSFQKDFLVPSECFLLLYLDLTDYKL